MEGENPREGWAALVLRHYHQRRAGVARIRQTWLPGAAYASHTKRHNRRAWTGEGNVTPGPFRNVTAQYGSPVCQGNPRDGPARANVGRPGASRSLDSVRLIAPYQIPPFRAHEERTGE